VPQEADVPKLLTIAEVATALRVSRRTVETLLHERTLATTRIGRRVFVRESDLDAWVSAQVLHALPAAEGRA
jgi:excisionase family DNA binding protein